MSRAIALVDTSIFCELLNVPGHSQRPEHFQDELAARIRARESMLLPPATIIETGNHIGQSKDGTLRRRAATLFVTFVAKALHGQTPFTPTRILEIPDLIRCVNGFVEWATVGSGFADLTIKDEWDRQCLLNPGRRVYIWTLDEHLSAYDRPATI